MNGRGTTNGKSRRVGSGVAELRNRVENLLERGVEPAPSRGAGQGLVREKALQTQIEISERAAQAPAFALRGEHHDARTERLRDS